MLSILQMKSFTGTKKIELNLNIGFGRAILSIISVSRRKLWNQLMDALHIKAEQKPSHHAFHINSP